MKRIYLKKYYLFNDNFLIYSKNNFILSILFDVRNPHGWNVHDNESLFSLQVNGKNGLIIGPKGTVTYKNNIKRLFLRNGKFNSLLPLKIRSILPFKSFRTINLPISIKHKKYK